ncbi:MAG: hypothetical protein QXM27_03030 [Candidatus Pacearchaeota archaeon]
MNKNWTFKLEIDAYPYIDILPRNITWNSNREFYIEPDSVEIDKKWESFKKRIGWRKNKRCWICGKKEKDYFGSYEAFWEWNEREHVQKLIGIHYLCNECAKIKKGLQERIFSPETLFKKDKYKKELIAHFCEVNNCTERDFYLYIKKLFKIWKKWENNEIKWKINFGKYEKSIRKWFGAKRIKEIKFHVGTPLHNLYFTTFSVLCSKWNCLRLWDKFKKKLIKSLKHECYFCGKKRNLHLHEPYKTCNKYRRFEILKPYLLCAKCHSEWHTHHHFGIEIKIGEEIIYFTFKGSSIKEVIRSIKEEVESYGINLAHHQKEMRYLLFQLKRKNWNKKWKIIKFSKIYNPLVEKILERFNGKYVKIYYPKVKDFISMLKFLRKAINKRNFECVIIPADLRFKNWEDKEDFSTSRKISFTVPMRILNKKASVTKIILAKQSGWILWKS